MGLLLNPGGLARHGIAGRHRLDPDLVTKLKASPLNISQHHNASCALRHLLSYTAELNGYKLQNDGSLRSRATGTTCSHGVDPDCPFRARQFQHSVLCNKLHRAERRSKHRKISKTKAAKLKKKAVAVNALRHWKLSEQRRKAEDEDDDDDDGAAPRRPTFFLKWTMRKTATKTKKKRKKK